MEAVKVKMSNEIFTILSLTSVILPFYGYADECRQFMTQLRSKSRKLWQDDMIKWFKTLYEVRRLMVVQADDEEKFEFLA